MRREQLVTAVALAAALAASACGLGRTSARERAREAWTDQDYAGAAAAYEEYLAGDAQGPEAEEAAFMLADIYYHNLKQYDAAGKR